MISKKIILNMIKSSLKSVTHVSIFPQAKDFKDLKSVLTNSEIKNYSKELLILTINIFNSNLKIKKNSLNDLKKIRVF